MLCVQSEQGLGSGASAQGPRRPRQRPSPPSIPGQRLTPRPQPCPGRPGPTHLPAAAAVVLPADDREGGFARGAEAAGLVGDPLGRVCGKRGGVVRQRGSEAARRWPRGLCAHPGAEGMLGWEAAGPGGLGGGRWRSATFSVVWDREEVSPRPERPTHLPGPRPGSWLKAQMTTGSPGTGRSPPRPRSAGSG